MKDKNSKTETKELMNPEKNSDNPIFEGLYESSFAPVFRYVYSQLKNREEAEDLTQNVFLKAYEKNNGNFSISYFFSIARNSVIDYWKKKKEILSGDMQWFSESIRDENRSPHEEVQKKEDSQKIRKALSGLSQECQEVITLKFLSGLTNKEISALINKKEDAIRQMQARSLRKLKELIKTYER